MGHIVLLAAVTIGVLVVGGTLLYEEIEEQRERTRRARVAASNAGPQQHETARTSTRRHDIQLRKRLTPQRGSDMLDDDEPLAATQQRLANSLAAASYQEHSTAHTSAASSHPQDDELLFDVFEPASKPFTSRSASPYIAPAASLPTSPSTVPLIPDSRPISRAAFSPASPTLSATSDYIFASVSDAGSQGDWHDLGNETSEDDFEQARSSARSEGKKAFA